MTMDRKTRLNRRTVLKGATATAIGILGAPMISRAQAKPIKIGMPTILSGRVAQLVCRMTGGSTICVERVVGSCF